MRLQNRETGEEQTFANKHFTLGKRAVHESRAKPKELQRKRDLAFGSIREEALCKRENRGCRRAEIFYKRRLRLEPPQDKEERERRQKEKREEVKEELKHAEVSDGKIIRHSRQQSIAPTPDAKKEPSIAAILMAWGRDEKKPNYELNTIPMRGKDPLNPALEKRKPPVRVEPEVPVTTKGGQDQVVDGNMHMTKLSIRNLNHLGNTVVEIAHAEKDE